MGVARRGSVAFALALIATRMSGSAWNFGDDLSGLTLRR